MFLYTIDAWILADIPRGQSTNFIIFHVNSCWMSTHLQMAKRARFFLAIGGRINQLFFDYWLKKFAMFLRNRLANFSFFHMTDWKISRYFLATKWWNFIQFISYHQWIYFVSLSLRYQKKKWIERVHHNLQQEARGVHKLIKKGRWAQTLFKKDHQVHKLKNSCRAQSPAKLP